MKKKIFTLASLVSVLFSSCGENSSAYKQLKADYDSVALVNRSYEQDLHEVDSLVATVLTNNQEISSVEGLISVNPVNGDIKKNDQERIRDNVQIISSKLQASSDALEQLTKKLENSGQENKRLRYTLAALKKEVATQKSRILQLTEELERKNIAIGALDSMVNNLSNNLDELNEQNAEQARNLAQQERELNLVRYCVGTKSDLKEMNLIRGGRVVTENANNSYFTVADLRNLTQIPLMSKEAKLLTIHPQGSYELVSDGNKQLTLLIKNPKAFWQNSKMLVIQVD